jgi:hypothetical protein
MVEGFLSTPAKPLHHPATPDGPPPHELRSQGGAVCALVDFGARRAKLPSKQGEKTMLKPIAVATFISGTLDILFAMILTLWFGREIGGMLRSVASGPFPAATDMGTSGALLGLVTHFALMAMMATAYMLFASSSRRPHLFEMPIRTGVAYGVVTYFAMNWVVVPLRFHTLLPPKPLSIATQLFAHIVLVGIPMALVAAKYLRRRMA